MNKKNQKGSKLISVVIILAVIVAIGAGGYYYYTKNVKTRTDDQEISRLEKEIGKLITLPTGEKPVLATIKDVATLSVQQPFFVGAQNGDKLLVYANARKAFIYSEERGKLVNVGPIVYDQNSSQVQTTKTTVTSVASTTATSTKKK